MMLPNDQLEALRPNPR